MISEELQIKKIKNKKKFKKMIEHSFAGKELKKK